VATKSFRGEVEALIPTLRLCARALVVGGRSDNADDIVHDVLAYALKSERSWAGEDLTARLFGRMVTVHRARMRPDLSDRRTTSGYSVQSRAPLSDRAVASHHGATNEAPDADRHYGLDVLSLNEREALVVTVLGRLDYWVAAQALGIPTSVLVTRLIQARDKLGPELWTSSRESRAGFGGNTRMRASSGAHLRLVKS
jgi:DNA-directed RNA polymerase specialized sigma24 family protein